MRSSDTRGLRPRRCGRVGIQFGTRSAQALRKPPAASEPAAVVERRRRRARFRVWEWLGIPSVSTDFARPVQEESPHLSEFPKGIISKPELGVAVGSATMMTRDERPKESYED